MRGFASTSIADALRRLAGLKLEDADGNEEILTLEPPATEDEIRALEARLPCPIPQDIRDALRVTKGLAHGPLESFSLIDLEGFGLEEMLPYAYSIAHDGFGNYWVLDLLPEHDDAGALSSTPATTLPCWPTRRPRSRSS